MPDDDPFDEFFDEIERMMNEMFGGNAEFHLERGPGESPGRAGPEGARDVHLDVHETEEQLRVVADIPGVDKNDIELKCDGTTLTLDATGSSRRYSERIDLPATVDEHSASATYNNGVLEVVFERADNSTSIDL